MNLIEQLGGYDFVKKMWIDGGSLRGTQLEFELLEHRRQHNIFEVGDKVFYTGRANDKDLYTIKEIYIGHDFVVGGNGADKNFWTLFLEEIRHATDAEIKAGHRL